MAHFPISQFVLYAHGADLDVDAFLARSPWPSLARRQRGDSPDGSSRVLQESYFSVLVSEQAHPAFEAHLKDAESFVNRHSSELERLGNFPGVTDVRLWFGWSWAHGVQRFLLPPRLLLLAATLGIGIELAFIEHPKNTTPVA